MSRVLNFMAVVCAIALLGIAAIDARATCVGGCYFYKQWNWDNMDFMATAPVCIDFAVDTAGINCPVITNQTGSCGGNGTFMVTPTPVCRCCSGPVTFGQNYNTSCTGVNFNDMQMPYNCSGSS